MHTKPESNWGIWSITVGAVALLIFVTLYMGGVFEGGAGEDIATPPLVVSPTE